MEIDGTDYKLSGCSHNGGHDQELAGPREILFPMRTGNVFQSSWFVNSAWMAEMALLDRLLFYFSNGNLRFSRTMQAGHSVFEHHEYMTFRLFLLISITMAAV